MTTTDPYSPSGYSHSSAPELFSDGREGGSGRPASRALIAALVAVLVVAVGLGVSLQHEKHKANDLAATVQAQQDQLAAARAAQSSTQSDLSAAQQRILDARMQAAQVEHRAGDLAQRIVKLQSQLDDHVTSPARMLLDAFHGIAIEANPSAASARDRAQADCGELAGSTLVTGVVQARLNIVESTMNTTTATQSTAIGWVAAAIVTTCPQFSKD